jgi:hypothetical protein
VKKNKLFSFISILLLLILFGTAAICNQCGITPAEETNVTSVEGSNSNETISGNTQSQNTSEEITAKQTSGTSGGTTSKSDETEQKAIINITLIPNSGPAGYEVTLYLSEPVSSSAIVYYNGKALPKKPSADYKSLTVTIPVGAVSGYFKIEYDGKIVQSAEQFTVTVPPVSFTFDPKSGPAGYEVTLYLSEPVSSSAIVYYNGKALPKKPSADYKSLTVTIPVGAVSGYFKIEYDGKIVQSAEQFTVTVPPQADLVITNIELAAMVSGGISVDIKNVGTADLNSADIHVICQAQGISRFDSNNTLPAGSDEWLKLTLKAGDTFPLIPSLIIVPNLYYYPFVICTIILAGDPTPNVYSISIP